MPTLLDVGNKDEEIQICPALRHSNLWQGRFLVTPRFKTLQCVPNITRFFKCKQYGCLDFRESLDRMSHDVLSVAVEKWAFIVDWKTLPREFWIMHHCHDGKFYLWPWPLEYFYQPLDGGDGFIKFGNGMLPGGRVLRLDDKIRISPVPEGQGRWVKIKYDVVEKQQVGQPNGRIIQTLFRSQRQCLYR